MNSALESQPADAPESWYERLCNWIWGYDFFISYHWDSGGAYAVALAEALRTDRFEIFLDRSEFAAGDNWRAEAHRAVRRTQRLVVVATREAVLSSSAVADEVQHYARLKRRIIQIVFDDTLAGIEPADNSVLRHVPADSTLYVRESIDCLEKGPTKHAVSTLKQAYDLLRRRTLRQRIVNTTISVLTLGLLTVLMLAWIANVARREAVEQLVEHDLTRGENYLQTSQLCESLPYFAEVLRLDPNRSDSHRIRMSAVFKQIPDPIGFFPHDVGVTYAELSQDGRLLLTADLAGAAVVWDFETASRKAVLQHDGPVRHASFNSTGTAIVTASDDNTARIWNWETNTTLVLPHRMDVRRAWFADGDKEVVTTAFGMLVSEDAAGLFIWDAQTGTLVSDGSFPVRDALAAELSPDRTKVAIWTWGVPSKQGYVCITVVDLNTKRSLKIDVKTMVAFTSCRFTPDSQWLLVTGHGRALLWNAETGEPGTLSTDRRPRSAPRSDSLEFPPTVPRNIVHAVLSSDDPPVVALAHDDGNVRMLDSGHEARMIASQGRITRIDFSVDNRYLQTITAEFPESTAESRLNEALLRSSYAAHGNVRVYDAVTTIPVTPPLRHAGGIASSILSDDAARLTVAGNDGLAAVWDLASTQTRAATHRFPVPCPADTDYCRDMHLAQAGDFVAGYMQSVPAREGADGVSRIMRWDRRDSFAEPAVVWTDDGETGCHFFDDVHLALADQEHVKLIDVRTGETVWKLPNQVADHDLSLLAWDENAAVLNGSDALYLAPLRGEAWQQVDHGPDVTSVAASLASRLVAVATSTDVRFLRFNGTSRLRDPVPIPLSLGYVPQGEFNRTGTSFLLWGRGTTALLVNTCRGTAYRLAHAGEIRSARFSPSGTWVLTTGADGTGRVWDAATGTPIGKAVWGGGFVSNGRFSADQRIASIVNDDVGLRLFETETGDTLGPIAWQTMQIADWVVDDRKVTMLQGEQGGTEWEIVDWNLDPEPASVETSLLIGAVAGYRIDDQGPNQLLSPTERTGQWRQWRDLRKAREKPARH